MKEQPRHHANDVDDEELIHLYCKCSPQVSLCGLYSDGDTEYIDDEGETGCVVCADLEHAMCPRCGD